MMFFHDIIIYSRTWEDAPKHVDEIVTIMAEKWFFSKEAKCEFGLTKILYLGHVISFEGVNVHQENIQTILDWPTPKKIIYL
jgi:hypothetical protein